MKSSDKVRTWSVALSTWLQSTSPSRASATALVRMHRLAREKPQMVGGLAAVARLVENCARRR